MDRLLPSEIDQAAQRLLQSIPVAFPTETVYGLGALVFDLKAIAKIFRMKGRALDNPLICHIASLDQLSILASHISEAAMKLADHFWPGPLTLVLRKKTAVPSCVTAGLDTVAIRMPRHPIALELIRKVGYPLVAPSANLSGRPSGTTAHHVLTDFRAEEGAVIDGGPCEEGIESTVVLLAHKTPVLLRPGVITSAEISAVLGCEVLDVKGDEKRASPGTRYRHYAPQAKLYLTSSFEEGCARLTPSKRQFLLSTNRHPLFRQLTPSNLYALLREADEKGYEEVIVVTSKEISPALRDRLERASYSQ